MRAAPDFGAESLEIENDHLPRGVADRGPVSRLIFLKQHMDVACKSPDGHDQRANHSDEKDVFQQNNQIVQNHSGFQAIRAGLKKP